MQISIVFCHSKTLRSSQIIKTLDSCQLPLLNPSVDVFKSRLDACWTEVYPNAISCLNQSPHPYFMTGKWFSAITAFYHQ